MRPAGIGAFLSESSVASCELSNNPSREKVEHIGSLTLSFVGTQLSC
jgi:hypothetical protein